jgi:DNA-binding FadR family transcriptional regulator
MIEKLESIGRADRAPRLPAARLGVAVVSDLVAMIVTGEFAEGELLPPEQQLCEHFGVSRTVLRESIKRLEEKGLVVVAQGRGTQVTRSGAWNMLDPIVLSALIDHDDSLGILDELTVVRASLEAAMAGEVARRHTAEEVARIHHAHASMSDTAHDNDTFRQADVVFHFTVMDLSRNRLAGSIAKRLYRRALESVRYQGLAHAGAFEFTVEEHGRVVAAIEAGDVAGAEKAMHDHIHQGWQRRRLPSRRPTDR